MSSRNPLILLFGLLVIFASASSPAAEQPAVDAPQLINALGCKGCHKLAGAGGSLAPELDQIGSRMTREQIGNHLAAHAQPSPEGFMPSYDTTSQAELKIISEFLYNLK